MARGLWVVSALACIFLAPQAVALGPGAASGGPAPWIGMAVAMLAFAGGLAPTIALRHPRTIRETGLTARPPPKASPSLSMMAQGVGRLHQGRPHMAVPLLKEAARQRPTDAAARYAYGVSLVMSDRVDEGLDQIAYAVRLDDVLLAVMVNDPLLANAGLLRRAEVHRFLCRMAKWYAGRIDPSYT